MNTLAKRLRELAEFCEKNSIDAEDVVCVGCDSFLYLTVHAKPHVAQELAQKHCTEMRTRIYDNKAHVSYMVNDVEIGAIL